ncbi:MAG: TatD family hydrolase [Flavobacteriales bacterium]|nr:TatD family hydrolase [Flavobacteriales bacterium]
MEFVDTHAHLYHAQFDGDRADMVRRAIDAGVTRLYLPNIDLDSVETMHALCDAFPAECFPMMGLHPCHVGEYPAKDLSEVERLLHSGRYYAVGETGIDLYWDKTWLPQQREAFRLQVLWARELDLPVVIHCRDSFEETIAIVEAENAPELRGVFHCFTGTPEQARRIIALGGFMLGIGGVITYPKAGLRETMAEVGAEHCVLETDAPYLAPVPHRGRRNESAYIPLIAASLAEATGLSVAEIARITTANADRLFGQTAPQRA